MSLLQRKIYKIFHPVLGEIWCLHRVVVQRSIFERNRQLELTPSFLEKKIEEYVAQKYTFVSLDEIYQNRLFRYRFPWQRKFVNVSFDDGFQDIYTESYPLLKRYNIPFTIYLTSDFPDKKAYIWWIVLEQIILDNSTVQLEGGESIVCNSIISKQLAYERIIQKIYAQEGNTLDAFQQLLQKYTPGYTGLSDSLVLKWEQIKEMCESGLCTIGSHTVSHPDLTKISEKKRMTELQNSKQRIRERLQREVEHFSYPHSFHNGVVEMSVRDSGYKTATMGYGGSIRLGDNIYKLNRNYIVEP